MNNKIKSILINTNLFSSFNPTDEILAILGLHDLSELLAYCEQCKADIQNALAEAESCDKLNQENNERALAHSDRKSYRSDWFTFEDDIFANCGGLGE